MVAAIPKKNYYNGKKRYAPFRRRRVLMKGQSLAKKVNNLSKAVSLNRKLAYGHIQRNLQKSNDPLNPTNKFPICFQASNFSQGLTLAPIYQMSAVGILGSTSFFSAYDIVNNGYWAQQNSDIPDTGMFRALYANYRFKIEGNPNLDSTTIRIDFITPRASSLRNATSTSTALVLPQSLNSLGGLCDSNMINPTYFKTIATRSIVMDSNTSISVTPSSPGNTAQSGHTSTTSNVRYCNFMLKINKNMYQATSGTNFTYQNTAYQNQVWCIISSDDQISTVGDKVKVSISRHVVWRDGKGSSSL